MEAGGVGIVRLVENKQLIGNSHPLETLKTLNWAEWYTRRVRGNSRLKPHYDNPASLDLCRFEADH